MFLWYRRALQKASHLLMRPLVAHCHQGLGDVYLRLGDITKARSELNAARELYRSLKLATE